MTNNKDYYGKKQYSILPMISVVIATFNSEHVLQRTLEALAKQTYPKNKLEILIIDGGSTDRTMEIAQVYGCIVIHNPKTEPVHAKLLGVQNAQGKYMMVLDHDEVLVNPNSLVRRIQLLEHYPSCKVAFCSGYRRPEGYPLLNQYISEYGDPFSLYMYNFSKGDRYQEQALKRVCRISRETKHYVVFSFAETKKLPIIELCCLATVVNLEWFKRHSKIAQSEEEMAHMFYIMLSCGYPEVIFLKNDPLVHYSVDSIGAYLPKLKWRIRNNVHFKDKAESGFTGREKYIKYSSLKKYFYVFYTLCIPISFIHGLVLAFARRNPVFLLHPVLCLYVLYEIGIEYKNKLLGKKPSFTSYDGKKKVTG